jgi:hypothetical protein
MAPPVIDVSDGSLDSEHFSEDEIPNSDQQSDQPLIKKRKIRKLKAVKTWSYARNPRPGVR